MLLLAGPPRVHIKGHPTPENHNLHQGRKDVWNRVNLIKKYYNSDSRVIYPCIDTEEFSFCEEKKDYYFYV